MCASGAGFLAGVLVTGAIARRPAGLPLSVGSADQSSPVEVRPAMRETPPPVAPPSSVASVPAPPVVSADPIEELRRRQLTLPVQGISRDDIRDNFDEMRSGNRRHEAIDVLAPRNTPVLAVEGGTIAKLFLSDAGGITIYQFDPSVNYVYYYAHLEGYAPGLKEKDPIGRGQVIGYVGTTGNAPRETPHLHFAIFKMTDDKQWWRGTAIDPYQVLR
jgi:murein DD-endopeptidase MepM/ murein hydrolase activator NlpD